MPLSKKQVSHLVTACITNDRNAQQALYKLFYADMLRVCRNYIADKELAKEAFNMGFLKVFQSINTFDPQKGELGGWIRRIMINTAIDMVRRELKFNVHPITEIEEQDILNAVHQLSPATQAVFNLSVFDGFTHKEISEQLGISEGTSRWHLSEGKRLLRGLLGVTTGPDTERRSNHR
jgi:RNA polymerase sigma factor (sigma-70 family)